jgi:hypothetical protein
MKLLSAFSNCGLSALSYTCPGQIMIECKELAGKVVRSLTLYEEGNDGPEVSIDFEDGCNFNVCLGVKTTLEAKLTLDEGGQPQVLKDYTSDEESR